MEVELFIKYEWLFRQLCENPEEYHTHNLRMNFDSFCKGLKIIYGGQPNDLLAKFMIHIFKNPSGNVKFSIFMRRLVFPMMKDQEGVMNVSFKILDEHATGRLTLPLLLRQYLSLPKKSLMAAELRAIFELYIKRNIKPPA